jgi:ketosteroid isomerase-like protein
MPDKKRVEEFVNLVVSGAHVEAIRDFYHADATMRENLAEPRRGRDVLMAHEETMLKRITEMRTHPAKIVAVDGDAVTIHWVFDIVSPDGAVRRLEEVALQRWQGDRILEEQFFYDSATAWKLVDGDANNEG